MHSYKQILTVFLFCVSAITESLASEKSVAAVALFNERAMLSVDGEKAKIIRQGETYFGVKLISANTSEAVIEFDGKRKTLTLNGTAVLGVNSGLQSSSDVVEKSVVLYEDQNGFFQTAAYIDGKRIEFLVDTGANIVVFNSQVADRLGLDYTKGRVGFASTASGRARMYNVTLDKVRVGGISLRNIQAGVIEGGFPEVPLLGMSFLGQLEISKKGDKMTLSK